MRMSMARATVLLLAWLCLVPGQVQGQERPRPWLGVTIEEAYSEARSPEGARVYLVVYGSPAASAGVRIGDVVTALNGRPTQNTRALQSKRPGDFIDLTIKRSAQSHTATARLAQWPEELFPFRRGDDKIAHGSRARGVARRSLS
jgi:S1-C subfamily serine protease